LHLVSRLLYYTLLLLLSGTPSYQPMHERALAPGCIEPPVKWSLNR
jgi:hypothetical protein